MRAHRAIEVNDLDEMTEVLAVCQGKRWPRGRGISVVTGSGGLSELILDNATAAGLDLPPLSAEERAEAERVIGRITGDGNPFDAWGNGNYAVNIPHAMSVVDKSERIDSILYCADASNDPIIGQPSRVFENVDMLTKAAAASEKPYYLMSTRSGVMNRKQIDGMRDAGLVVIGGTRQGLGALDRMGRWSLGLKPVRTSARRHDRLADELKVRRTINEFDSKRLLSTYGIPVAQEQRVATEADALAAARALGYPVVLKVVSDAIAHKTELGLVAVNLKNDEELTRAYARLNERLKKLDPRPAEAAFLVQEFVADGIEVFAGVSRDPDFGLSLAFGMGGVAIEVVRDFALRMLPLRDGDAEAMIAETRGAALLGAVRGAPGERREKSCHLSLRAGRFRLASCRCDCRNRSQSNKSAARRPRLRRGRRVDRHATGRTEIRKNRPLGRDRRDVADLRHRLRQRGAGEIVADDAQNSRCGTHGDRKPRIGIKHRLAHPIETTVRQRAVPARERVAACPAVARRIVERADEKPSRADAAFPTRPARHPIIGGASVVLAGDETGLGALDHAAFVGSTADQRKNHRTRHWRRFQHAPRGGIILTSLKCLAQQLVRRHADRCAAKPSARSSRNRTGEASDAACGATSAPG